MGQIIGKWRKAAACYELAKHLTTMCSSVLWKVDLVNNEIDYLVEKISKESAGGVAWLLLTA